MLIRTMFITRRFPRTLSLFIALCVLFSSYAYVPVFGTPEEIETPTLTVKAVKPETIISQTYTDLQVSGRAPVIEIERADAAMEDHAKQINQVVSDVCDDIIQQAQNNRVQTLLFDYEVQQDGSIISIQIQITSTRGVAKREIRTINYHLDLGRLITISDILGSNGIEIANKVISDAVKKNPEKYNPNYKEIQDNHNFYIKKDVLIIVFDEYEIAAGSYGIQTFEIDVEQVINVSLPSSDYHTKTSYGLKMMPLRRICEAFGYEVKWNDSLQSVDILKDSKLITSLVIGVNNYGLDKDSRTLEAAPEIQNGATYVPVSFFRDILGLIYSIDSAGTATFSYYEPPISPAAGAK